MAGPVERRELVGLRDDLTAVAAHGEFVVVPIVVTNLATIPTVFNPAHQLVVVDRRGRHYQVDVRASGAAYLVDFGYDPTFAPRQPGVPYPDALVFDVPDDAEGLVLESVDESFSVKLAAPGATPSP